MKTSVGVRAIARSAQHTTDPQNLCPVFFIILTCIIKMTEWLEPNKYMYLQLFTVIKFLEKGN